MKLKYKLILLISSLIILLTAGTIFFGFNREVKEKESKITQHAKAVAKMIATLRISEVINKSTETSSMGTIVKIALGLDPTIAFIGITDKDEKIIAGEINEKWIKQEQDSNKMKMLEALMNETFHHRDLKKISIDIVSDKGTLGSVKVGFSLKPLFDEIFQTRMITIAIGCIALIVGFIGAFLVAARITGPITTLARAMEKVKEGNFDQKLNITGKDEIGYLGKTFNLMTEGLKERERIKETFSRYVSRQVAEKVLNDKDNIHLHGEKRIVTVLFSDIRGFTSLSEKLSPEEVVDFLNEYFSAMVDIIFRYGGTLDKFIGDAIMAVFNAPSTQDMPELRAVITGIRMQEALSRLNKKRISEGKHQIFMGIGINTGEVIAGNIGSERRLEYTVIGKEVNLAQRIESKTEKGQIMISESTYNIVKDFVDVIKLPHIEMKGITEKVTLYSVIGLTQEDPFMKKERI